MGMCYSLLYCRNSEPEFERSRNNLKKESYWSHGALEDAIAERAEFGPSFEKLSTKYKIPLGTLH